MLLQQITPTPPQPQPAQSPPDQFWSALPGILWWGLALILLVIFFKDFKLLVKSLTYRIRAGAAVKFASFEVGPVFVIPSENATKISPHSPIKVVGVDDGEFSRQRSVFRDRIEDPIMISSSSRNLFIVHKIAPSRDPDQLYDVRIYIIPSLRYGTLEGVRHVDYYFGNYWGRKIFRSAQRESAFLITTSAYAPFSCTAKISFNDDSFSYIHRLVDFEMGTIGNSPY